MAYDYAPFPYVAPPGLSAPEPRHPVTIIGAGPVGLTLAIDLAQRGVKSVVLDDNNVVSVGSRAICWAKRTLEIFDRIGVGDRMLDKGITWKVGRQFHRDTEIFAFDLLPEEGHKYPAFINLQQYYVEQYLIERTQDYPDLIDVRFLNKLVDHTDLGDHVRVHVETPDGLYPLETEWMVACDGAGSPTRNRMNLAFDGETFEENFLIVDVELDNSPFGADNTPERWFWFDPPFHNGQSALLHKQPDNIYRIDLQLGPDTAPETEALPDRVMARIKAIIGDTPFRLDWQSVYRFRCARLADFVHNRTVFAGDSAHVVSPFGARGGNGGIQDVDNLGWKLAAVCKGSAPPRLINSYNSERGLACDENILNSARATNFMTPKTPVEALFRDEVLGLAARHPFARGLINSGRLSLPCILPQATMDSATESHPLLGSPLIDAPIASAVGPSWLIREIPPEFCLLHASAAPLQRLYDLPRIGIGHHGEYPCFEDRTGLFVARYGFEITYLLRPDGHICAVFKDPTEKAVASAVAKALKQNT